MEEKKFENILDVLKYVEEKAEEKLKKIIEKEKSKVTA